MAKGSKTKKSVQKKTSKKQKKGTKKTETETPVQQPVQQLVSVPEQNVEAVSNEVVTKEVSVLDVHSNNFKNLLENIQNLRNQLTQLTSQVKNIQKSSEREMKKMLKESKKKKSKVNRAPSGFVKPTLISKELASFLGKPKGTEMARTEVTREINIYIRAHKLQNPNNGRIINADSKLRKLLNLKKEDELTYFNLQRFMSPHFAKKGKPLPE